MRSWFRRVQDAAVSHPTGPAPDSPTGLAVTLDKVVDRINRSGGRLPVAALVVALDVTDIVDQLLETTRDDPVPDIEVILAVRGIVEDYLPTTLDRYLALDPVTADQAMPNGTSPRDQVIEQLQALATAAGDVLAATRRRDADDLVTQGHFLRTKFTRSDLDL
jgi:hypothetical protein